LNTHNYLLNLKSISALDIGTEKGAINENPGKFRFFADKKKALMVSHEQKTKPLKWPILGH